MVLGKWTRPPATLKQRLKRGSATCSDVAMTSLTALRDSADAFPPLKSAVAGVLVLWQTAERVKTSKKKAKALSHHALRVLEELADAVSSNPSNISPSMLKSIRAFEDTVNSIQAVLEPLTKQRFLVSFSSLNRNEEELEAFSRRLEEAFQAFTIGSLARVETQLQVINLKTETVVAQQTILKNLERHLIFLTVGLF